MTGRLRVKEWLFRLLGKDPEAVVVSFRSGDPALADAMCAEIRRLEPGRRHFEVKLEDAGNVKARFRGYRIGLAPVLFTDDPAYDPLRRAAYRLAPRKILAYNARLERHHLKLSTPIASWLFLRGVPLDRIFLRPAWLFPWRKDRTMRPEGHRVVEGYRGKGQTGKGRTRVAILTPYFPYPLSHGGAVRIYHLLREIAREFDVTLYAFAEGEIPERDLPPVLELIERLYLAPKPRYREPRWSTLRPPEVCEYASPAMLALWRDRTAAASQIEYTHLASYGGDILVEHDVTFDLYAQVRARHKTAPAWWNWTRWRRFETRAVKQFKQVVVMSEKDCALLSAARTRVVENGVDVDRFEPAPEAGGRRLLFIGSFRHFPNIVAFRFLTEEILPLLPDAELTVVAGPEPWLHWRNYTGTLHPPESPRVRVLEFVADVRPLYRETNIAVVPTLESAGTNVKVLEALAMQRAVVSTSSGCAGLGLQHGEHVWMADSAQGFAAGINTLLDDPAVRARIAETGRAYAVRKFDWRKIGRRQRELLREVAGDPITLRAASNRDVEAMRRIQESAPEASQWESSTYLGYDCVVAVSKGSVVGLLVSRPIAPGEREILNLAVDPAERRKGIARRLLEHVLEGGDGVCFLEVRESNQAAIGLYRDCGFAPSGRRENYYDNPREAAIVMRILS